MLMQRTPRCLAPCSPQSQAQLLLSRAVSQQPELLVVRRRQCTIATATNSSSSSHAACPSPAETARTIVDISSEGTLSLLSINGQPLGTPISYSLDKQGQPLLQLGADCLELQHLKTSPSCSLLVQPISYPARAIGSVALSGSVAQAAEAEETSTSYSLSIDKVLYFGGLDQSPRGLEVSGEEYRSAEPDVLRKASADLVATWNMDRAEDLYRIVSSFLSVPLTEMAYAELLWIDRLGMYVRSEVEGGSGPTIVRVPFMRPVVDERDARSVITMAAQLAWERERNYTPPVPAIFAAAAAGAAST